MTCQYCRDLTIETLLDLDKEHRKEENYMSQEIAQTSYYAHQPSFQSLQASAQRGCEFCHAIVEELRDHDLMGVIETKLKSDMDTAVRISISVENKKADQDEGQAFGHVFDRFFVRIGYDSDHPGCTIVFGLNRHKDSPYRLTELRVGRPYLGSVEIFDFARSWIRSCTLEHPNGVCPPLRDYPLPTRIIDIGPPEGAIAPRLFVSNSRRGMYTALSHCWGNRTSIQTTMASLDSYVHRLPLLPPTFRDALQITRELGFRYCWIDSLCIIQDSREDWERECATMDDVYKNAAITIAAGASIDNESGILQPPIKEGNRCHYHGSLMLQQDSSITDRVEVSSFEKDGNLSDWMYGPLGSRGWAYQERLLSQRVLNYGESQVYLQCRTTQPASGESMAAELRPLTSYGQGLLHLSDLKEDLLPWPTTVYNEWLTVVYSYTDDRELTYPGDKLPALAGIARMFQEFTSDEYLAGIWRNDLMRGLLWNAENVSNLVEHPSRAPSWSWARWDGPIEFHLRYYKMIHDDYSAVILGHNIQHRGLNHLGEVQSGAISLRGWVAHFDHTQLWELGNVQLDVPFTADPGHYIIEITALRNMQVKYLAQCAELDGNSLYTVIILGNFLSSIHYYDADGREELEKGMLILKPTTTLHDGGACFQRFGMVTNGGYHGDLDLQRWTRRSVTII